MAYKICPRCFGKVVDRGPGERCLSCGWPRLKVKREPTGAVAAGKRGRRSR